MSENDDAHKSLNMALKHRIIIREDGTIRMHPDLEKTIELIKQDDPSVMDAVILTSLIIKRANLFAGSTWMGAAVTVVVAHLKRLDFDDPGTEGLKLLTAAVASFIDGAAEEAAEALKNMKKGASFIV